MTKTPSSAGRQVPVRLPVQPLRVAHERPGAVGGTRLDGGRELEEEPLAHEALHGGAAELWGRYCVTHEPQGSAYPQSQGHPALEVDVARSLLTGEPDESFESHVCRLPGLPRL